MAERQIQRISPLTVTEAQRATLLIYGPGTPAEIGGQELITTSDQRRLFRGSEYLGPVDHGSVASAEAMAAIYLFPSCTRGVWPGDTVWRSDEEREYRVISGANASAVWRAVASSRPDLDAAYAPTAHTHAIGDVVDLAAALSALEIGNPTPTVGQMLYCAEAGVWSALPAPGVVGQVLTAAESGTARIPQWVLPVTPHTPRVAVWLSRVSIAGGTLTDDSESIASALVAAMNTRSWAGKIVYLLPFLGGNLAAALIPLIDTRGVGAAINTGFVGGDFAEGTGLQGAAGKWLATQLTAAQLGAGNSGGIGLVELELPATPVSREEGGYADSGGDQRFGHYARTSSPWRLFWWGSLGGYCSSTAALAPGHVYGQRSSATDCRLYVDGSLSASDTTSVSTSLAPNTPLYAMGVQGGTGPDYGDPIRCGAWYATDGTLTDAEVADLHSFLDTYLITPTGR